MPNTNPSDLDREALKAALGAWTWQMSYTSGEIEENLQSAIAAYLTSLPRASGVPEAEAAAWRLDWIGDGGWQFTDSEASAEYARKKGKRVEPLFASPPPVAAPSGEALAWNWRNDAFETAAIIVGIWFGDEGEKCAADIRTQIQTPPPPIASEPKDTGGGEYQALNKGEQAEILCQFFHLSGVQALTKVEQLTKARYAIVGITRTARSGAKP